MNSPQIAERIDAARRRHSDQEALYKDVPRWEMSGAYPHHCEHCEEDYNHHYPWPALPCRKFVQLKNDMLLAASVAHMNDSHGLCNECGGACDPLLEAMRASCDNA